MPLAPSLEAREDGASELIHRSRPGDKYLMIENATVQNRALSYLARGMLAEMLSRPPGWRVTAAEMAAGSPGAGRRAVQGAFRELRSAGYLHRVVLRGEGGRFRTQLHAFSEAARCDTAGCQDCTALRTAAPPADSAPPQDLRGRTSCGGGDVSAGRTDIPLTDRPSPARPYKEQNTNDSKEDRRPNVGHRAAASVREDPPDPAEQRKRDLVVVAQAATDYLKIIMDPGGDEASYLLRTLTRSGARPVSSVASYARAAFSRDPDMWRTLTVYASDNGGHVSDESADEILSRDGARAAGENYDSWTENDFYDEDGAHEYLDLRREAYDDGEAA